MTAIEILIADSLAASLSLAAFDGAIGGVDAVRTYTPDYTTEELADLKVSVVPGPVEVTNHTRQADLFECEIHVVLGKKFDDDDEIDDLQELRTNIVDAIRSRTLPVSAPPMPDGVAWMGITNAVTFDQDQVMKSRVFLADIAITYRYANAKVGSP
jgi:hypothetical protein